jgi:hypothetical protein
MEDEQSMNTYLDMVALRPMDAAQEERPIPLVKIHTCGGLRIEVLQHPTEAPECAQYAPVSSQHLIGRGAVPAITMIKMLLGVPGRYRSIDWLKEYWYPDEQREAPSLTTIHTTASYVRTLLSPPYLQGEQRERFRRQVLRYEYSSLDSGNGYRLGSYPLIWLDVDALEWHIAHACQMELHGDNALPYWQGAYELAMPGVYLPEEAFSDWAEEHRVAVMGALRQSVHALSRLYLMQYGTRGHAEAMRILRNYLAQHPADEDALRVLMELFGTQERFQEAEEWFQRTKRYVEAEGSRLDARTLDVWAYLRSYQIHRHLRDRFPLHTLSQASHGNPHVSFPYLSDAIATGIVKAVEQLQQHHPLLLNE